MSNEIDNILKIFKELVLEKNNFSFTYKIDNSIAHYTVRKDVYCNKNMEEAFSIFSKDVHHALENNKIVPITYKDGFAQLWLARIQKVKISHELLKKILNTIMVDTRMYQNLRVAQDNEIFDMMLRKPACQYNMASECEQDIKKTLEEINKRDFTPEKTHALVLQFLNSHEHFINNEVEMIYTDFINKHIDKEYWCDYMDFLPSISRILNISSSIFLRKNTKTYCLHINKDALLRHYYISTAKNKVSSVYNKMITFTLQAISQAGQAYGIVSVGLIKSLQDSKSEENIGVAFEVAINDETFLNEINLQAIFEHALTMYRNTYAKNKLTEDEFIANLQPIIFSQQIAAICPEKPEKISARHKI